MLSRRRSPRASALRILIIAHDFPPLNSSASRRPYSWARTWSRLGHEVHVLTTAKYATDGTAYSSLDCSGFEVHEMPYLPLSRPVPRSAAHDAPPPQRSFAFELVRRATRRLRLGLGVFTQTTMLARRALLRRAIALHAEQRFDFVISSSGPEVCSYVAHSFSRRTGTPWIADYRDLWFAEFAVQRYRFTTWFTGAANLRMLRAARAVSTVSEGLASYLRPLVRCPVWVSYNGYLDELKVHAPVPGWPDGRVHLVYTGNFYPGKRDPESFFAALAAMPELHAKLRLDVYGPAEGWVRARVAAHGLAEVVVLHGQVSYAESLGAQRAAHALLFVDWMDARAEGVLTGKLFEYLASGRPTLCIGNRVDTEAARIIAECRAGETATAAAAIRAALGRIAAGNFGAVPDAVRVRRFAREEQARLLLARISERVSPHVQSEAG